MAALLLFLPWAFRAIGIVSAIVGLFQGQQVLSGGYGASPWNLGAIAAWLSASVGSWVASWLTSPTSWAALKTALDRVFEWVKARAKIDPNNQTDADERVIDFLEEYILKLLAELVKRWSPEAKAKADVLLADLRYCRLVAKSGQPSEGTVSALAKPPV